MLDVFALLVCYQNNLKVVSGSFRDNLERLNELGQQGYELRSVDYYWGKKWAFYVPEESSLIQWEYQFINDCIIQNQIPN